MAGEASAPRPFIGLLAGAAAGIAAAAAMAAFQAQLAKLPAADDAEPEPHADAGPTPYIVGAVMGGIYGVLTEYKPEASLGFGGAYGLATAALADPASALEIDPADESLAPQPFGVASHLIFGAVLEGVRWLIAGRR